MIDIDIDIEPQTQLSNANASQSDAADANSATSFPISFVALLFTLPPLTLLHNYRPIRYIPTRTTHNHSLHLIDHWTVNTRCVGLGLLCFSCAIIAAVIAFSSTRIHATCSGLLCTLYTAKATIETNEWHIYYKITAQFRSE